tara:strand:+ start:20619 stop:21290 length:672 start_codon:yes stop_codon:yes gene_type:complete
MLSTTATRESGFIAIPRAPEGASSEIGALYDRIAIAFVSDDEAIGKDWETAKAELISTPCRTGADIAAKLLVAMHEISPHRQNGEIGFSTDEFVTDQSIQLLASVVNDVLAIVDPEDRQHSIEHLNAEYHHLHDLADFHPVGRTLLDAPEYAALSADNARLWDKMTRTYRELLIAPAMTFAHIALKLDAAQRFHEGCVMEARDIQMIARQARALSFINGGTAS